MASIEQYQSDIQKYHRLESKINRIVSELSSAERRVSSLDFEIKSTYKVNGDSANISNRTTNLARKLNRTIDQLVSVVLPAIQAAISNAQTQITALQEAEENA